MFIRGAVSVAMVGAMVAVVRTQGVPPQLGMTEPQARESFVSSLTTGSLIAGAAGKAFVLLPAAGRVAVVQAGFVWMKAYANSAAFKTSYATVRENHKPMAPDAPGSIDAELKRRQDEDAARLAESRKALAMLPAAQRAEMEANLKQMEALLKSPEQVKAMRADIEANRADAKENYDRELKEWQEQYPANPLVLVGRRLRAFLAVSSEVDFTARLVRAPDGRMRFANEDYEQKPSEWKMCFRAGREATAAARAAATDWLKELPAQ